MHHYDYDENNILDYREWKSLGFSHNFNRGSACPIQGVVEKNHKNKASLWIESNMLHMKSYAAPFFLL
jgi:hypothetical protein